MISFSFLIVLLYVLKLKECFNFPFGSAKLNHFIFDISLVK